MSSKIKIYFGSVLAGHVSHHLVDCCTANIVWLRVYLVVVTLTTMTGCDVILNRWSSTNNFMMIVQHAVNHWTVTALCPYYLMLLITLCSALVAVGMWHDNFTWQVVCHCPHVRNLPGKTVFVYTSWCVSLLLFVLFLFFLFGQPTSKET